MKPNCTSRRKQPHFQPPKTLGKSRTATLNKSKLLLLSTALGLVCHGAMANDWQVTGTGSWSNPDNWAPNDVPNSSDAANISTGTAVINTDVGDVSAVTVGVNGGDNGTVQINAGGALQSVNATLGLNGGSSGSAVISGTWQNGSQFYVGKEGSGTLSVENGGYLGDQYGYIGVGVSGTGTATISGTWVNSVLYVGNSGAGTLDIKGSGYVESASSAIGYDTGAVGTVTVSGSLVNNGHLFVGFSGTGTLDIKSGGYVESISNALGYETGAVGTATVSGTWVNSGDLSVGRSGTGTLDIKNGGYVESVFGFIGIKTGAVGTAMVSGTWKNSNLLVGENGTGTLDIKSGGYVSDNHAYLGKNTTGNGTATVSGTWVNSDNLYVGYSGTGTLDIKSGGYLEASVGFIGSETGGVGTATVSGSWVNNGSLFVGGNGTGTLEIKSGGYVESVTGSIGNFAAGVGTATVSGSWANSGTLYVGASGTGTLDIKSDGYLESGQGVFGNHGGGVGTATVSGTWMNRGNIYLGYRGTGTLEIKSSGYVESVDGTIGDFAGAAGTATVSGTWVNSGNLYVGNNGTGTLDIKEGGYVSGTVILIGNGSSVTLSGTEGNRGTISTAGIAAAASGTMRFDGGVLQASGNTDDFLSGFMPGSIQFQGEGAFLDTNRYMVTIASAEFQGAGGLTKLGGGDLLLSGSNSYSGGTLIEKGVLAASDAHALGTGAVYLKSAGTLSSKVELQLSSFTWDGGGAVGLTLSDGASLAISGTLTKGTSGDFRFSLPDIADLDLTQTYTLATFAENDGFDVSNFIANDYYGRQAEFTLTGTSLSVSYADGMVTNSVLQNSAPVKIQPTATFQVIGATRTGESDENNTIHQLFFSDGSSLEVHNTLTVTSGTFVGMSGTSHINGDPNGDYIVTPNDLVKTGPGNLTTNVNIEVGGRAFVDKGGLVVNGRLHADAGLIVAHGAYLGGSGSIDGDVTNSGYLSPGNSPGTLTVNGDYDQTGHGAFLLEVGTRKNFDRFVVSGAANLSGRLEVLPYNGYRFNYGDKFTFIKAGSIHGTFDPVNLPGFRGRLMLKGGDLTLLVAPQSYAMLARTPNEKSIAKALDHYIPARGGDRETVSIALDELKADEFGKAFSQIAPTFYETLANITIEQSNAHGQMLQQRFGALRLGFGGFSQVGLDAPIVAERDGKGYRSQDLKAGKDIMEVSRENPFGVWIQGNGLFAKGTSLSNLPNYRFDSGGFLLGVDYRWNSCFATGLYAGYQNTHARYDGGGDTRIDAARFGVYGTFDAGNGFYANGILGGGYSSYDVHRTIEFGSIDRVARSTPNGAEFNAMLGGGYDWKVGNFTFGPVASAQYTFANIGAFEENGARSLNLRLEEEEVDSLLSTLGARIAYSWHLCPGVAVIPEGRITWQHQFLRDSRNLVGTLNGGSGPGFVTRTAVPSRDAVFAGAGVNVQLGDRWMANVYYNADFGSGQFESHAVSGGVNVKF